VEKDGTVCLWELKEDNHSLDALLALAQIVAGEHDDRNHQRRQLDSKALRENWEKLSSEK
jgi:hypothetical protein